MDTIQPLISVVIPAYNEERFLKKTLLSLQKQTYPNFEVIVVDNGSTDKTADIAKAHGARVISEPQKGVARARQTGFLASSGELIAMTDADTIVPPDWLKRITEHFSKDKKIIGLTGVYYFYSGSIFSRLTVKILWSWFGQIVWQIIALAGQRPFLTGSNCAVRKEVFLACGGFNTKLAALEDWDLGIRLRQFGDIKFDPSLIVLTSGRRYSRGFLAGLLHYLYNYLAWQVFKSPVLTKFPDIRSERSFIANFLMLIAVCLFCLITYSAILNPQFSAQAKIIQYNVSTKIKQVTTIMQTNVWKVQKASF
jgi:glycosyltransferase involved in cell wall biosynthesis